ncbi:Large neutral amino acids transporter small subunit [Fasciola hepatica]|uniref:Large neutral amino acids transporter small subunit n=1 Tax=Fasciola hepatica TaxID=6192 RepID=A0A4E0S0V9_FASHE|nr:Large neutral amino acids transporter small subunit [Fasciola hepatica]
MKEKDNGDVTMEVFHANSKEKEGVDTPEVTVVNDLDERVRMKPTIGLLNSITIIIGSMIGSGIFISPSGILANMNSFGASILIWIACGIYSLLGAYCYAELGTMLHSSGGDYAYVLEAFGPFVGFLRLWVEVIVARPVAIAIISMTFAQYILQPIYPDCEQPKEAKACLATMCVLLLSFINGMSVRMSTLVQDVFTLVKMAALLLIIVTGLVQIGRGHTEGFEDAFEGSNWGPGAIANAFYTGLFAYSGWNYLNCMIEEMSNPRRDLPIAIVFSCLTVTTVYTLANVAYVSMVSVKEILASPAVAITFASRVYGPVWWIMPIFVACSTFGGVNGTIMTTSRIFFVASRENQMPRVCSFLQMDLLTPIPAVIITCIISIVYLLTGSINSLITYLGFVQWLAIGLCVFIVIVFRFTRPDAERPVRAPIAFAVIYVLGTIFLVIFAFVGSPTESGYGVAIIVVGIPFFFLAKYFDRLPKNVRTSMNNFTVSWQKLLKLVPGN